MKRLFAAIAAMMLVPTIPAVCCAESYQNIETLREQSPKEVVFDCKDQYGRNIYIDTDVIIPEVECVPIVVVEKPKYEDCEIGRVCGQYADATEEDGAKRFMYSDNGFDYDIQIFTIGNTDVSILAIQKERSTITKKSPAERRSVPAMLKTMRPYKKEWRASPRIFRLFSRILISNWVFLGCKSLKTAAPDIPTR